MKKQYKAPEIEVLLFDFREIAMNEYVGTGELKDESACDFIQENPWGSAEDIESSLDSINEVTY
ncbi:hypothetical protein B5E58_11465 [Tyzzerella sp. An114]|uniref:hypothetical protein n=1 Tax=Tyzzerella sp. An114 TaxID=1965545 RepID=UPI000B437B57|nr:hypothetical protein [Tyzzerella sp. An114]OUQ56024.1 hypothetical protein B5E58_11465 [Tyzzerella sp. An114]